MFKRSYDTVYDKEKHATKPFRLSRSKIDAFIECPRCFWLDRRLGIKKPDTPPFQINKAVDELLKKEFDKYREAAEPHPYMVDNDLDFIPFMHDDLDKWRENFVGVSYLHKDTNLEIFGAVDDLWVNPDGQVIVVDYKATAKKSEVSLDAPWQIVYKRQMEVYQWLLRQNNLNVEDTGYFVYCNGDLSKDGFDNKVEFRIKVIPYTGNTDWIEPTILEIKKCLDNDAIPKNRDECEYCNYAKKRTMLTLDAIKSKSKK